jgi:hypothetical protein
MTDQQTVAEPAARTPTKAATVQKLLARSKGATLAELTDTTSWQPHTARAFLTGLRKKGTNIVRECRPNGDTCWRIER